MYNLSDDPFEASNLSQQDPEQLKTMMTLMKKELVSANALYPLDPQSKQPIIIEEF